MVSEEDEKANLGMNASTIISGHVHATSTVGLKVAGTICLVNVTAEGQTQANNDFGRDNLVNFQREIGAHFIFTHNNCDNP